MTLLQLFLLVSLHLGQEAHLISFIGKSREQDQQKQGLWQVSTGVSVISTNPHVGKYGINGKPRQKLTI